MPIALILLALGLGACSGSEEPDSRPSTPTSTADREVADKAQIASLVNRYWEVMIRAENTADTSRTQFVGLAEGEFLEAVQQKLERYERQGIRRVGAPEISDVDVEVHGDTAAITLCLDEDRWTASRKGKPLEPVLLGNRPFGLEATLTEGAWQITDTGLSDAQEAAKKCL